MEKKSEPRAATERWRQMPDRVRPEDGHATTPASPPPANQVISGDAPILPPQG
ncbi:hypothetical protein J2S43_002416 [Catenuloplanes nepalensis]|uniref:Uncharacterized protein n=1 Tax=Catenuloplanes nepalensis TaxID=587533 RepID=A0ABT9MR54_9ACTN|nr:hypothetical protein [Catenuloplanes nepalensis]MDP9793904.1 hypothetical protein [Catenuloplanes nepalensis]